MKKLFKSDSNFKKILLSLIISLAIPLTVIVLQKQQELRQHASEGASLYVSTDGKDSNPGTKEAPLATINKTNFLALPGTTIHVQPGTYANFVLTDKNGTQNSRITYVSDTPLAAKIVADGASENTDSTWQNKGNYVDIIGFDISGGKRIGILNRGNNVSVKRNLVHDISVDSCTTGLGGAGIDSAENKDNPPHDNIYSENMVKNVGPLNLKPCSYVHAIYIQSTREKVLNNIIVNNAGIGVACTHACDSPTISNNLILNNGYGISIGWSSTNILGATSNAIVTNNIIMKNAKYSAIYERSNAGAIGSNNKFLNNLFWQNAGGDKCTLYNGDACTYTVTKDPLLSNPLTDGTGSYQLLPTSPAIDSGTSLGAPKTDYVGNIRPQGKNFDIGPYEYTTQQAPTSTSIPTPSLTPLPKASCLPRPSCLDSKPPCLPRQNAVYCSPTPTICPQVISPARNPYSGQCLNFPNPCSVPKGWSIVKSCDL